ncbi:class I SAM-dependent methyltransferase [Halalkalibacter urbisdiaboli]|uniref:class I SAM-dependent methyltransferase n=1 Tax=Halalkalibacter urbisdiaboli TaxID=1960589 RepID=UPI001A99475D|nr:class I SAM-dependent methyltransferase [Halalkalibacter urbisdiaboli]
MIVTTARKGAEQLYEKALMFAEKIDGRFIVRKEQSVEDLKELYNNHVLVVGKGKVTLYHLEHKEPFFYHPNSAMFRVKQYLRTNYDPLVEAAQLSEGKDFLDCTLGLASDSLVAKVAVGNCGRVVGVEANPYLACLVDFGLKNWQEGSKEMLEAMRGIEVIHTSHLDYLSSLPDNAFDVVYFDPMFEQHLANSTGIKGLKWFACHDDLSEQVIVEAKRVAKKRIVLKDHWQSTRFDKYQFVVMRRQHSSFHYAYIEV